MVAKSHGPRRRTRSIFKRAKRSKFTVNRMLQEFEIGQNVAIDIDPSSSSMPFRRFQGRIGKITDRRGDAYIVEISERGKLKKIISMPQHLKIIK